MKPCRPFDAAQPGACDPALAARDDSEAPTVSTPLPPPDSAYGNGRERPPERVDEQRDRPRLGGNRPVEGLDGIGELAVLEPRLPEHHDRVLRHLIAWLEEREHGVGRILLEAVGTLAPEVDKVRCGHVANDPL